MRTLLVLLALLLAAAPASAADDFYVAADASGEPGWIALGVVAPADLGQVTLSEDGEELGTVDIEPLGDAAPGLGYGFLRRATRWRCDRLVRHFNASGRDPESKLFSTGVFSRTPSCRNRVALRVPPALEPGERLRIVVRDTFRSGDVPGRLCVTPPGAARRCRPLGLDDGRLRAVARVRADRPGGWTVAVRTAQQRLREVVAVGVPVRPGLPRILVTGDSQMQNLDALIADRLTGRAVVTSDVHNGSGLVLPDPVDWAELPGAHTARGVPTATIIALGANDAGPMDGVACCGPDWRAEYVRRARTTMRQYTRDGGHVFWLTIPAARAEERRAPNDAVNEAIALAATRIRRAHVLDTANLFTPGGRYRGRLDGIDVRARDGIHLSIAGAAIAAAAIDRALRDRGLIRSG